MDSPAPSEALLTAVKRADFKGIRARLRCGDDPDIADANGSMPLHFVSKEGLSEITDLFMEYGANPNVIDHAGATPLHYAAKNGHDRIVQQLLEYWASPNIQDNKGLTALHHAASVANVMTVKLLLKRGADRMIRDADGALPIDHALNEDIVNLLEGKIVAEPKQVLTSPMYPITINEIKLSFWPSLAADTSDTKYVVIQCREKQSYAGIAEMIGTERDCITYASNNTYVCYYSGENLDTIRQMEPVVFADTYRQLFKLSPIFPFLAQHAPDPDKKYKVDIIYHKGVSDSTKLHELISKAAMVDLKDIKSFERKVRLTTQVQHLYNIVKIDEVHFIEMVYKIRGV